MRRATLASFYIGLVRKCLQFVLSRKMFNCQFLLVLFYLPRLCCYRYKDLRRWRCVYSQNFATLFGKRVVLYDFFWLLDIWRLIWIFAYVINFVSWFCVKAYELCDLNSPYVAWAFMSFRNITERLFCSQS